jgi:4-hydroxy-3-polyprenylbenzoate decarboxylase
VKRYILAISGASGSLFGIRLLEHLVKQSEVHLIISSQSFSIISHETGVDWSAGTDSQKEKKIRAHFKSRKIYYHNEQNLASGLSSGSFITHGMLVVPCSMKTLSGISHGYANNLTERAADVSIKEGRPLLLSPREMPFSAIHLENMLKLARLGVIIAPPVPAFYQKPKGLDDMADFVVGKIMDSFGIQHTLFKRWGD